MAVGFQAFGEFWIKSHTKPCGIALEAHGARDVTVDELAAADVIVVMEVAHVERVRRRAPYLAGRVQLLPLYEADRGGYGGREQVNLLDPFGHDAAAFAHCYRRIEAALRPFVAAVLPSWGAAGPAARP